MVSASSILAAMSDDRPGRFYSVDELAAVLRVSDKAELRALLRTSFRLLQGASGDFYRRVSFGPTLTLCEPWQPKPS